VTQIARVFAVCKNWRLARYWGVEALKKGGWILTKIIGAIPDFPVKVKLSIYDLEVYCFENYPRSRIIGQCPKASAIYILLGT
jgi:hypothetical protein